MKNSITSTSIKIASIPPPNPTTGLSEIFGYSPSICLPRLLSPPIPRAALTLTVKCSKNDSPGSENGGSLKDVLSGMVDERVEELLNKEENRDCLDGLVQASRRVEMAKRELAEIEMQEMEAKNMRAYISQLESRASEIEECQKEIMAARTMVEEAERSLMAGGGNPLPKEGEVSNKDKERVESLKAAFIAAVVGTLAELPICLSQVYSGFQQLVFPLAITFISCALFGVTFRYAIRRDLDNFQLKSETSAAFGFVKGLGMMGDGSSLELDTGSILSYAFKGAINVSESLLVFLFAGVALDFCFKLRILSPFPIDRS